MNLSTSVKTLLGSTALLFAMQSQATNLSLKVKAGANLKVNTIYLSPVKNGYVQAGSNIRLGFSIKNFGLRSNGRGSYYRTKCLAIKGGPCPIANVKRSLPAIKPGQSRSFQLISAMPAQPGKYRVYVTAHPASRTRARYVEFRVSSGRKVILSPAARKLIRKIRLVPHKRWVKMSCNVVGPVEFPKPKITNTDTVTMPAGSKIFYIAERKAIIRTLTLKTSLAPGQSVYGFNFEAYSRPGRPHRCVAVGRMNRFQIKR